MIRITFLIMSNPQLAKMIYRWLECKHSATLYTALIASITIILFTICLIIPAPKHFYRKVVITTFIFLGCTVFLSMSSQIRYHDSKEVAAFQKIQLNRQLGTRIPQEKHAMKIDNKIFHKYEIQKHPNLKSRINAEHAKHRYSNLSHLLYERKLFNERNNHIKEPSWFDNL